MNIINFRHLGIVVKDIQKQLFFYKDLLGLEVYYDNIESGKYIELLLGEKGVSIHIYKLGKGGSVIVELLDFGGKLEKSDKRKKLFNNGITHFAVQVDDLESLFNLLKQHDVHFINQPIITPDHKFKVCFCEDYEGNFIELVEKLDK